MAEGSSAKRASTVSLAVVVTALVFGALALSIVLAELIIPIPGTGVVTDPRELFTTIGAALTGPLGGLVVGILAGAGEAFLGDPGSRIPLASLIAHIAGGLWMGFAYKKLVYERIEMPGMLLGWAALVLVFYYGFAVPGFVLGQAIFYKASFAEFYGANASLLQAYGLLARGASAEAVLTTLITTLAILALPRKYRRPLW